MTQLTLQIATMPKTVTHQAIFYEPGPGQDTGLSLPADSILLVRNPPATIFVHVENTRFSEPMSLSRLLPLVVCAISMLSLNSCGLGSRVDVTNPTIAEMDALDVQWGLAPRKAKGGPRRNYQYMDTASGGGGAAAAAAPAGTPARETISGPGPAASAPAAAAPAATPSVPANLR